MENMLRELDLNPNNSIVIGSGVLQALGIRKSKDIDMVVNQEAYGLLKESKKFTIQESHGRETLSDDLFEIAASWNVLDRTYKFEDFISDSIIIDGVRYITLEFLYKVKKSWLNDNDVRQKDIDDVKLIENYLDKSQ